ncbi:MAG TPA: hypothetical protein P5232_01000 [Candidatus Moranbacteria bacterium]|nr:hypothetical protein [Candidatus Moranbacteria bacterium]
MTAMTIVRTANLKWHFKGMMVMPFIFRAPTVAVNIKRRKVRIPPRATAGIPKNVVSARAWIINLFLFN